VKRWRFHCCGNPHCVGSDLLTVTLHAHTHTHTHHIYGSDVPLVSSRPLLVRQEELQRSECCIRCGTSRFRDSGLQACTRLCRNSGICSVGAKQVSKESFPGKWNTFYAESLPIFFEMLVCVVFPSCAWSLCSAGRDFDRAGSYSLLSFPPGAPCVLRLHQVEGCRCVMYRVAQRNGNI
jgi:hypothetical protein